MRSRMRECAWAGTNSYICLYVHTCMYEYVYAYMNVRMMRAYEREGAHVRLFVCMSVFMYVCFYICMNVRACVRVCVCIYVCPLLFF